MNLNPFLWTGPINDGVPRSQFAEKTALTLKSGTHIALFGARGLGKTSFVKNLDSELIKEHGDDAPPWDMIYIDLRRAISLPAFIGAIADAANNHPNRQIRRKAAGLFRGVEKELGVNIGVVKAGIKSGANSQTTESEVLHAQLKALSQLSERIVIVFDEFQRLSNCPGEPLGIIRSALMGPTNTGKVSLLFTGSMREKLKLMLHTSADPIWDQTYDSDLPDISYESFMEYIEQRLEASGYKIDEKALEYIFTITKGHPKRTQQLVWYVWEECYDKKHISIDDIAYVFEVKLMAGKDNNDFYNLMESLLSGTDADTNEARALFLVASGSNTGSKISARQYGLPDESSTKRALERLQKKGHVQLVGNQWRITDPFMEEWLKRDNPLQLEKQSSIYIESVEIIEEEAE